MKFEGKRKRNFFEELNVQKKGRLKHFNAKSGSTNINLRIYTRKPGENLEREHFCGISTEAASPSGDG